MGKTFMDCLHLWTTVAPYCMYPSQTIGWRLVPAFVYNRYWTWYAEDGGLRGFATWGWMMDREFETREYDGWEVFSREKGEKLVIIDMIAPKGRFDVVSISKDVRKFCKRDFPKVKTVWAHRGDRDGWFPNKG